MTTDSTDSITLESLIDEVIDSIVARTPDRLRLAEGARCTENGATVTPGDGLWSTVTAVVKRHVVTDPSTGQAAVLALAEEGDELATLGMRIRASDGRISELEMLICREGQSSVFGPARMVTHRQAYFDEPVPAARRTSREEMLRLADGYLQGIEDNTSALAKYAPDCQRYENGLRTTNHERIAGGMGTAEQLDAGFFAYIERVRDRRLTLVDEERGLVYGSFFLDVPGDVEGFDARGKRLQHPPHMQASRSALIFELFRIEEGVIEDIDAVMVNLPYRASSGWES